MNHRALVLVLAPLVPSTCYKVEEAGTTTTLSFDESTVLLLGGASAIALLVGIALVMRGARRRLGFGVVTASVIVGGFLAPMMWIDRVVITPEEIRQKTGFWFAPTRKGFRYADVESVTIREESSGRRTNRVWFLDLVSGGQDEIDPGDLWENNEDFVVDKLTNFGVRFR